MTEAQKTKALSRYSQITPHYVNDINIETVKSLAYALQMYHEDNLKNSRTIEGTDERDRFVKRCRTHYNHKAGLLKRTEDKLRAIQWLFDRHPYEHIIIRREGRLLFKDILPYFVTSRGLESVTLEDRPKLIYLPIVPPLKELKDGTCKVVRVVKQEGKWVEVGDERNG